MECFSLFCFTLCANISMLYGQFLSPRDSVRMYYHHTLIAEQKIMDDQIDSSLWNYNEASKYHKPFMADAYNGLVASIKVKDTKSSLRYIDILVSKGISPEFFIKDGLFNDITTSYAFVDFWEKEPEYNEELYYAITELYHLDQKVRKVPDPLSDSTMYKTDLYIGKEIDSLFALYGYLSEDMVSVFQEDPTKLPLGFGGDLAIILIHQVKMNPHKYKRFFEDAVLDGKMKNTALAMQAVNFGFDSTYLFKCFYFGIGDILRVGDRYFTCGKELESLIDHNRERVYLPPLSHTIRINNFKFKNTPFLLYTNSMYRDNLTSQESIDKLVKEVTEQGYIEISLDDEKRR